MTKTHDEMAHKFSHLNTPNLRLEIDKVESKVVAIQRSKDHHKQRAVLSELQSSLHRMKLELKRREREEKHSRYSHSITPSATA